MTRDRVPRDPTPTPFVPDKSTAEYIQIGDAAFASGDHGGANSAYKRAFDKEKDEQKLEEKDFYRLISQLSIAYSRAGDTKNARVTAAYGISKEYDYALFHYALASSYGVEADEMNAIHHLESAYEFKKKLAAGEKFPDPLSDESFAGLADSSTFKSAVARMKR